jgi:hypothetical protein
MNEPLQSWITANKPAEEMIYKDSWSDQVCFVRDKIPTFLVHARDKMDRDEGYKQYQTIRENITVISTHTSKSILLPVYCIKANGDTFIIRNNFHDWKVSVETHDIHNLDWQKLGIVHNIESQVHQVYCEGFKPEWVYKPYADDKYKYTIEIYDKFQLKMFFWFLQNHKLIKEGIWID